MNNSESLSVTIFMATFNGEQFLTQQLDSLAAQTFINWHLIVSDDGSTDSTLAILKKYQESWRQEKIIIRNGPKQGFAQNFLSLACDKSIKSDFYAFCDQDDVWLPQKLEMCIKQIRNSCLNNEPFLYCGRTVSVDEKLKTTGQSTLFKKPPSFENALVQSIAGGNTMVFNQTSKTLVETVGLVPTPSHDWWLYLLISGVGGRVFYDPIPWVLYRQHEHSIVGENTSIFNRLKRLLKLLDGRFKTWFDSNITCLHMAEDLLISSARVSFLFFTKYRNLSLQNKIINMKSFKYYRQSNFQNLILKIAFLMNKI